MKKTTPYDALASGYDLVMAHVDYELWADYIEDLLAAFHPEAASLLELGCGTGSLALALAPRGPYRYQATDGAATMIEVARRKTKPETVDLTFAVADFLRLEGRAPVDAVLLLYDGLNYLLTEAAVRTLFAHVRQALRPGGVFIFDQSTPANSVNNAAYFEDEGQEDGFHYVRRSRYDPVTQHHTTRFELVVAGDAFHEEHIQRAYTQETVGRLLREAGFAILAAYDGFSTDPATDATERIHWVVRPQES